LEGHAEKRLAPLPAAGALIRRLINFVVVVTGSALHGINSADIPPLRLLKPDGRR